MNAPQAKRAAVAVGALTAYIAAIFAANWLTSHHHQPIWVFPGMVAAAGTYSAGFALLARDWLQDTAGKRAVFAAILIGAVMSAWLAGGIRLASGSAAAFAVSELLDMAIYTPIRRHSWAGAVLLSNTAGALVDTTVFLWLAGPALHLPTGMSPWDLMPGQLVGKILWGTLPFVAIGAGWQRLRPARREAVAA